MFIQFAILPRLQTYDFGMWDLFATRLNPDGSAWGVPLDVQASTWVLLGGITNLHAGSVVQLQPLV